MMGQITMIECVEHEKAKHDFNFPIIFLQNYERSPLRVFNQGTM
ncbi:hypothetical protein ACI0FR_00958 [Paenochrobactrum sp. BZR 201-1]